MTSPKKQTLAELVASSPLHTWVEIPLSAITKEEYAGLIAPTPMDRILGLFNEASNRDFSIESAAIVEKALSDVLKAFFVERAGDELFGKQGKVKDFDLKIELAHGLGLISSEQRVILGTVRKIRNRFAHDPDLHHFEHDEYVLGAVRSLGHTSDPKIQLTHRQRLLGAVAQLHFTLQQRAAAVLLERRTSINLPT